MYYLLRKFFGNTTNLSQHLKRIHPTLYSHPTANNSSPSIPILNTSNEPTDHITGAELSAGLYKENAAPSTSRLNFSKNGPPPPKR